MNHFKKTVVFVFSFLGYIHHSVAQCSACRATVESQIQNGTMTANGINHGILYLMAIPYLLMVGVGYMLYQNYKKRKTSTTSH